MKKIVFILLAFLCLPTFAQLQKSVVFDFDTPKLLTPSIIPKEINGGAVNVTKQIFTQGPSYVSFILGPQPTGSEITTFINPYTNEVTYSLRLTASTTMVVGVKDGAILDSIRFSNDSSIGDLHLVIGEPGELDPLQLKKFWKSGNKTCSEIKFAISSQASSIQKMTVYYTTPSAVLTPTNTTIDDESTVGSFSSMALTFASNMRLKSGSGILLTNLADNTTQNLNASCDGNVVVLTAPVTINEDGEYSIIVPAGCFVNSEGYENQELTYHFKVYVPRNTFNDFVVSPELGKVNSLNDTISISYSDVVKLDTDIKDVVLNKDGTPHYQLSLSVSGDKKTVYLTHEHGDITIEGTYTLTLPEKTIHNDFLGNDALDRYNAKFNLEWTVENTSKVMKEAKALLANSVYVGLGYPATDSESRKNLEKLVNANPVPTDEELKVAIGDFFTEANVTMPTTDNYYKVVGINVSSKRLYLAYQNGNIVLNPNAKEGAPFLVKILADKTVTLQTRDGKYLHVLTAPSATGTVYPNVTDTYNAAINNLTLAKLNVAGADSTRTIGLFSLSGSSITTSNVIYSQLNYNDNTISSQEGGALAFTADNSCAFLLEETDQYADVQVADANCTLTPTQVENNGEKLILSFSDVEVLTLENATAPYFTNKSGAKVVTSVSQLLTTVSGSTSSFSVNLSGLSDGTYTLVIPQYSLFYTKDGKVITTAEIKKDFTIKAEPKYQFAYDSYFNMQKKPSDSYYKDEELNELVLYNFIGVPFSGMAADPTKIVRLAFNKTNETIRTGHFEAYDIRKLGSQYDNAEAIKLVFDSPIKLGELRSGEYVYVIPEATFGDANFRKYLNGDKSVKAEDCKVNFGFSIYVNVDNDAATPKYPSDEVLASAKELLKKSGLGYPATNSASRTALQKLVDSGLGLDETYLSAMDAFYKENDVQKPDAGKYYTIAGVASNNKVAYLQYDGTNVTLTADAAKATGFKAAVNNGIYTFQTGDGKYLHTLTNSNDYTGTSKSNVTTTLNTAVNNLLLTRLGAISNVEAKNTMGLFSIYGSLGKDTSGNTRSGFSLVDADKAVIMAPSESLTSFTTANTNAFRFAEIDKAKIPVPAVKYTLSPVNKAELLSLKQVTVTFSYPGEVTIADKSKVTLKDAKGTAVAISGVTLASGTKNKVNITFAELAAGTYTLTAAEGAFTYTFAETKKNVPAITATYTVPAIPEQKYTLTPTTGAKLEELSSVTLTFSSPTNVTLKDAAKITLVDANKKAITTQAKAVEGKQGVFTISFDKLQPGTYTLTAAKGAFAYTLAGQELLIDAITATYTVEAAADIKWALSPVPGDYEAMNSLTLTFTSNKDIALADQSKITLKNVLGMAVTLKDIKKDGNKFTISFDKLGTGPYTFEAAEGAFTYTFVGKTVQVEAITAKYTILAPPEVAVAVYPGTGTKFESLPDVKLTFTCTKPIELADASKVKLTDAEGHAVELKGIENEGNVYTIEFDELPSGNYTFSVEKGAFVYTFGGEEIPVAGIDAISYTIVPKPQVTWAVNPDPGSSLESLSSVTLTLTADRTISLADKSKVTLTDEAGNTITPTNIAMEKGVCTITFVEITASGTYTLTAAQGAFTYQFGGKPTPVEAITATYKVAEPRPSEVVLAEATELLKYVGLGYPTADSDARKSLSDLVESEHGTDEVFTKAMDDFYAETNVEMPAVDKYYHIIAITAVNDTAYVSYDKDAATLVDGDGEATPLKLTAGEDGKYVLTTADGKQQVAVTISKKEIAENKIDAFGLFSISTFDDLKAIGFTFAEVDKADIPVPEVAYVVTPESDAVLEVLDTVTVSFTGYDDIALVDKTKFTLVNASNEEVELKSIEPVEGSNKYVITIGMDEPGTYTLTIDKGAFSFDYADLTHQVDAITATYKVAEPRPSEETLLAAKELLKYVGLGFPTADSDARKALSNLVEAGRGTDEVFQEAMDDFYAETNVVMPAVDKYYHIVAITAAKDTAYVSYGKDATLVDDDGEATPLKLTEGEDGKYVLTTADGKQKMEVAISKKVAEDAKSVFGLFSISVFDDLKAIGFTFAEVDKEDIPVPEIDFALTPKSGTDFEVLDSLTLTFTGYDKIDLTDDSKVYLKGDSIVKPASIELAKESQSQYIIRFDAFDVPGSYELTIEKGAFTFDYADIVHQIDAITATYVVKEPVPSDSILAAAKELLKLSGVGYPAADSKSRVALDSLINGGKGKDEVFEAAMAAFIAETDVEQPADGKYYRVTAVNSKGAEGFVTYEKGGVGLTADAENPTVGVFRVTANVDGTLTLSTFDSQYECDVKPARLAVEGVSAEETFGLFSLYGTLGGNKDAYSRVSIENGVWEFMNSSVLDKNLGMMLDEDMTTAFRFTEVAEEDLVIPEATLTCIPGEGSVEKLEEVTLMFDAPFPVTLKDSKLISLKAQDGSEVPIVAQKTSSNACQMTLINVVAGTYTLEVADGAFTYGFFDKEIPVKATSKTFKVLVGADFTYDFNVGDMACQLDGEKEREYFMDTALNTLTVGFKDAVTVNPDKTVFVVDEDGVTMVTGHLEPAEDEENVYKLVLDTPIAEGTLPAGTYTFVFEEGMFGDDNYASYLASPYHVLMADCHVSKELKPFSVKVDNEKAQIPVGILELMNGELSNVKWYDLNGRRIVGKPQKGRVYIVNGKKVTF